MRYIGTKDDCRLVSQERVSVGAISHECAFKQCVGPTHLFLFFKNKNTKVVTHQLNSINKGKKNNIYIFFVILEVP